MTLLWRYTLQCYLRILLLSVSSFIVILIVAKFKDMARFAALSASLWKTMLFALYQVPSILPIAIPISALISSLILFQRLSKTSELIALRSSGLSIWKIISPLLFLSSLLALMHFSLTAELSPFCRRETKALFFHETSENPLLLLQRQNLVQLKKAYLDMVVKDDQTLKDVTLITYNSSNQRLNLLSARKLKMKGDLIQGIDLAICFPYKDSIFIENQECMSTSAPLLSAALKKKSPHVDVQAMNLKMLHLSKKKAFAWIEIAKRISLSLSVFSLTFLGSVFGMQTGRLV